MHSHRTLFTIFSLAAGLTVGAGCGSTGGPCDPAANTGCDDNQVCELVQGGDPACFQPVLIKGRTFDLSTSAPVPGARVVALDDGNAAISHVAISGADGAYTLRLPSQRKPDGAVIAAQVTLRADASLYQSFPAGVRPALPINTGSGTAGADGIVIENPATAIGLLKLPAGNRGTVIGKVVTTKNPGGVLITGGGSNAVSDLDGSFTLFNVTAGAVTVRGYAEGLQLAPAMTTVQGGGSVDGVVLADTMGPLGSVSGKISLANAPGISATSVLLVVKETFNAALERGEVPRGLRVRNISNAFTINNVPDGDYRVLASFENDGAVRDPDTAIGGTALVDVSVPTAGSRTVSLPSDFKVTAALPTNTPGKDAPEAVTTLTPTFKWGDDSSEDGYELHVFDAFGTEVYSNLTVPRVTGNPEVSVTYAGPALIPGLYYQFRALSWRSKGAGRTYISRTEDLRGVFFYRP